MGIHCSFCFIFFRYREDIPKVDQYVERVVPLYNMDDFRKFFRMSRHTFQVICEQLGALDEFQLERSRGRKAISIEKQLMVFMWYVGSLEPLCRIADRFNVTEFSVLRIRKRICGAVLRYFKTKYIVWPNAQDKQGVKQAFQDKRGFPNVIGAIDGTHIEIRPPKEHAQTYVNRKGYHSIILQCVCREDMRFTDCFAGWPGSCHDSRVLRNSDLWEKGDNLCGNDHIIGDGAYPIRRWLLTPYRDTGRLTPQQNHYNFCHCSTRQVIERSFSLLKGRFRRLQHIDVQDLQTAVELCICCCVFHNICILEADALDDLYNDDRQNHNRPNAQVADNDPEGVRKRDRIAQMLP